MTYIFFDLETSDKDPIGQILNYSFIRTTKDYEIEGECSGNIALSPLQLPMPEALLANKVRILDHQAAHYSPEPEALLGIARFIADCIEVRAEPTYLVGFNSSRFDVPYLRTSMIRNGINPYFGGKIKYKDILHWVRSLYVSKDAFPLCRDTLEPQKLSLRLETVAKAFGVLEGAQTHHSRDDVVLTINLCKVIETLFKESLDRFQAYTVGGGCREVLATSPQYDTSQELKTERRNLALLAENYRAAVWIDLDKYRSGEGRKALQWLNKNAAQLQAVPLALDDDQKQLALAARQEFRQITPDNFFSKSTCDIEQDIYRLDMQKIATLERYVWSGEKQAVADSNDNDLKALAIRYWLAYGRRGGNETWQKHMSDYAQYRYGGELQLSKNLEIEAEGKVAEALVEGEAANPVVAQAKTATHHCTFWELVARTELLLASAQSEVDRAVLSQLLQFIQSSAIAKVFEEKSLQLPAPASA